LGCKAIVRAGAIGEIVDHHCANLLFLIPSLSRSKNYKEKPTGEDLTYKQLTVE